MTIDAGERALGEYRRRLGGRLRAIRRQKGLSLQEVEAASGQEFKASVLGAYERGERALSVPRLQRLAQFYDVPVDQLLPSEEAAPAGSRSGSPAVPSLTVDLRRLEAMASPESELMRHYLASIQVQRQDFNGRVLTVRRDDLRAIACFLEVSLDEAVSRLGELGLLVPDGRRRSPR